VKKLLLLFGFLFAATAAFGQQVINLTTLLSIDQRGSDLGASGRACDAAAHLPTDIARKHSRNRKRRERHDGGATHHRARRGNLRTEDHPAGGECVFGELHRSVARLPFDQLALDSKFGGGESAPRGGAIFDKLHRVWRDFANRLRAEVRARAIRA